MPFSRPNVTIAARVMLPTYPAFAATVGLSFLTLPPERIEESAPLRFVDHLVPLWMWGTGYLIVAVGLATSMALGNLHTFAFTLTLMAVWMFVYAGCTLAAVWGDQASWSAWTWPAFVGIACWASALSLLAREGVNP